MWNFLRPDSKFISYANKFCDLIALNLITLLFSVPLFTIGAASAAMHDVLLRVYRDELENGVIRRFVSAFRSNFKKATLLWLLYFPIGLLIVMDLLLFHKGLLPLPEILKYLLIVMGIAWQLSMNWVFILQSRYENNIRATVRNSFLFCALHPIDSLLISIVLSIPYLLIILLPQLTPVVLFCGFGLCGILSTGFYHRIFLQHERNSDTSADCGEEIEQEG